MASGSYTEQGIQAFQSGDRAQAQRLFTQALAHDPQDERAWLWLAGCLDDPERQRYCLQRVLALRPDHAAARRALERLASAEARVVESSVSSSTPPQAKTDVFTTPPTPARPASRRLPTVRRSCLLLLLALLAIAALTAAALVVLPGLTGQTLDWPRLSGQLGLAASGGLPGEVLAEPTAGAGSAAPTLSVIQLPPTWTPTVPPEPGAAPTQRPTAAGLSLFPTTSPVPSITPIHGYRRIVIGRSVQNRLIEVVRFGAGRKERMIIAGIHGGDEQNTIDLADELIEHLSEHPELVPEGYTLYILRVLNPDGSARARGEEGRLNANGVDLNRNFDTNWQAQWRAVNCASAPGTAGRAPGSEPETQAVKKFLSEREVEVLINYHSAALGVFPSGSPAHPGSVQLAQAIAAISDYAYPPMDTGCEYTGTLVDWAADHGVVAAVDLELNSVRDTEFEQNVKVLELLLSFPAERASLPTALPPPSLTPFPTVQRVTATPVLTDTQPLPTGTVTPRVTP